MTHRNIPLEWNIVEHESEWANLSTGGALGAVGNFGIGKGEQYLVVRALRSVLIAMVAVVIVAGTAQPPWERERIRVGNGIQAALGLEEQAIQMGDQAALGTLIDKQAAGRWQSIWKSVRPAEGKESEAGETGETKVKLVQLDQAGGLIMAEVIVHRPAYGWSGFNPYRETRFYRETSGGWLRTMPESDFWGESQLLETEHFSFELHTRDAPFVETRLSDWEECYRALYSMLGLEIPAAAKLTFVIKPEPVRGRGGHIDRFELTSPLLVQTPDYLSRDDYLTQSVVSRLAYHVTSANLFESSNGQRYEDTIIGRWRIVRRGLRGWLRNELLEPDWPWDQQAQAVFYRSLSEQLPLKLTDLTGIDMDVSSEREALLWQTAASASIFAYVTDVYDTDIHGDELLPALVQGFKEHRTWEALLSAVLGASIEEFERDWNRWLEKKT